MTHKIKILEIEKLTHDVLKISAQKPEGYIYTPGQAADLSIDHPDWKEKLRAFTFTSLPSDAHLEFNIKTYPSHKGVTNQLLNLSTGDTLLLQEPFGEIAYKGEGLFLAGGAGVTPFIAILKQLEKEGKIGQNKLIFANKTAKDIILKDWFSKLLGKNFINILSDENNSAYKHGYISAELIESHAGKETSYFYLCGPNPMMDAVEKHLSVLGIPENKIIKEGF